MFLAGAHDLGKYTPTFQALRADLALAAFGEVAAEDIRWVSRFSHLPRTDTPHGLMTAVHVGAALESWGASRSVARMIATVLGGHHGFFPEVAVVRDARVRPGHHGKAKWFDWRSEMLLDLALLQGLPDPASLPWHEVQVGMDAAVGLAALTSVSDWIASDKSNFPYAGTEIELETYVEQSRRSAQAAVGKLRWAPWRPPSDTSFHSLFGTSPRHVQRAVEELAASRREPVLLLVEAPTGEGKTKTALQAAATLVRDLELSGVYVAMPTRATSNQVYDEFAKLVGDSARVHLIHSTANDYLSATAARSPSVDPHPREIGMDEPDDQDGYVREWFIRAKSLLVPLGVGTVDQLLKAVIRSRHGFVRLAGLSGKVVILDEIHAYDTYMSTLIDRLLWWLGYLGVPVILLSATLPSSRRHELVVSWQAGARRCHPDEIPPPPTSTGYPRITYVDAASEPTCVSVAACDLNADRPVHLLPLADDQVVERAMEWAARSADTSVAVIHNLVGRATDTFRQLQEAVEALPEDERPQLELIHGQLGARQRQEVEQRLRTAFGPEGTRPRTIVVGTQVLEQSLDLDFDAMITDLAPIDSLIQRFGRLHRHRRDADRGELMAAITGVEDHTAGPVFPRYVTTVYAPMVLLRTWAVLRDRAVLRCPAEVPVLVDQVYDAGEAVACPAGWETRWQEASGRLARDLKEHAQQAEERYLPPPDGPIHLSDLTSRSHSPSETRRRGGRGGNRG